MLEIGRIFVFYLPKYGGMSRCFAKENWSKRGRENVFGTLEPLTCFFLLEDGEIFYLIKIVLARLVDF